MTFICFEHSYAQLAPQFHTEQRPSPVESPALIRANDQLAKALKIDADWLNSEQAIQAFAGNSVLEGSHPISTVYAGHQFGGWNPQLGDGRAILLGEVVADDGRRYDIQLKGAGQTPYSRNGDGRSPLGPVLREYILGEAMAALGVPTTRSLAAVSTGETVVRETLLPGAILTRVASSHIRIGTFQYFSARGDNESVRTLLNYAAERHYPETVEADNPALAFLEAVINRQAELIAKWQLIGFIHGVMNTDNMLICGETVDYGPCAFMDGYDPNAVYSSIDTQGRYAYSNQPRIAHWNLSWLAQSVIPLLDDDQEKAVSMAQGAIDKFPEKYQHAYDSELALKLGFAEVSETSKTLGLELFDLMANESVDFTLCFRKLTDLSAPSEPDEISSDLFEFSENFDAWIENWQKALKAAELTPERCQAGMRSVNPAFIPRNHLVDEVIQAAQNENDSGLFHRLVDLLENPYEYQPSMQRYATPPRLEQVVRKTFCGT